MGKLKLRRGLVVVMLAIFSCVLLAPAGATAPRYEDYHSQLEMEYFIPFIVYDGSFRAATYGKMSSILRDQELQFVLLALRMLLIFP